MKQMPYLCKNKQDFVDKIEEFRQFLEKMPQYSCVLVSMYVDNYLMHMTKDLLEILKNKLPKVKIIGGVVSANITAGVINLCGISVTFSVFTESQVDVMSVDWDDEKSSQFGKDFLGYIRNVQEPVAVQMISSGYNLNVVPFFKEISNAPDDVVFFGGIVNDGTMGTKGFVFTEDAMLERGMVIAVYRGRKLQIHHDSCSGWTPLGHSMVITALADNGSTIKEIDGMTVRQVYEKYLGITWGDSFLADTVVFPFSLKRNNSVLCRLPRYFYPDGSANYGADFALGEKLNLCYGNPLNIIQMAQNMQMDTLRFQPEGIFAVSCWARKVMLDQDVNQELAISRGCAPSTGIYALGEYFRDEAGQIYVDNMNLSIIAMREGSICSNKNNKVKVQPVHLHSKSYTIMSQMMHFVQAVSNDLEAYTTGLSQRACYDGLTGLLNRGELDVRLDESISYARRTGSELSVIILDLDDFKGINDGFGHMTGDIALKCLAGILRDNVTERDAAGRWGGDEFFVVLQGTGPDCAMLVAEKIRRTVAKATFEVEDLRLTCSLGVTCLKPMDTKITLFQRADEALYIAKNKHKKNNVTIL